MNNVKITGQFTIKVEEHIYDVYMMVETSLKLWGLNIYHFEWTWFSPSSFASEWSDEAQQTIRANPHSVII